MPKLIVLCDLDRTLLDTDKFVRDIWFYAADKYGLDASAELERRSAYYDVHAEGYDYRFFDHVQVAAGCTVNVAEFTKVAAQHLSGQYLYDDVSDRTIASIDAIVTFGNADYQNLKLSLCPALSSTPHHIILEPKVSYIDATFDEPYILIDDKPLGSSITSPSYFVRITRSDEPTIDKYSIKDFSELPELLQHLRSN